MTLGGSNANDDLFCYPSLYKAVLSIDDDIVVSCEDLDFWVHSWTMNRR